MKNKSFSIKKLGITLLLVEKFSKVLVTVNDIASKLLPKVKHPTYVQEYLHYEANISNAIQCIKFSDIELEIMKGEKNVKSLDNERDILIRRINDRHEIIGIKPKTIYKVFHIESLDDEVIYTSLFALAWLYNALIITAKVLKNIFSLRSNIRTSILFLVKKIKHNRIKTFSRQLYDFNQQKLVYAQY